MHLLNLGQGFDAHAKTEFSVARDVDIEIFNKSVCKNIIIICLENAVCWDEYQQEFPDVDTG